MSPETIAKLAQQLNASKNNVRTLDFKPVVVGSGAGAADAVEAAIIHAVSTPAPVVAVIPDPVPVVAPEPEKDNFPELISRSAKDDFIEKPLLHEFDGSTVLNPIITDLAQQVEYFRNLAAFWESRYLSIKK